jgi:hypothetical protein
MTQLTDRDLEERFNEFLDEVNPTVIICGLEYEPSDVLKSTDPVGYRVLMSNWLDEEISQDVIFEHSDGSYHDEEEETENECI